jgi:urease accessory protein
MKAIAAILIAAIVILHPISAFAHAAPGGVTGFFGGFLHPFFVPAHIMAVLSMGFLIGRQPSGAQVALALFGIALVAGFVANLASVSTARAEDVVLVSAAICGALVALAALVPIILLGLVTAITGFAMGLDSSPDGIEGRQLLLSFAGSAVGAMVAALIATGIAATREVEWQRIGLRVTGSWIAAGAIMVLALRFAR